MGILINFFKININFIQLVCTFYGRGFVMVNFVVVIV